MRRSISSQLNADLCMVSRIVRTSIHFICGVQVTILTVVLVVLAVAGARWYGGVETGGCNIVEGKESYCSSYRSGEITIAANGSRKRNYGKENGSIAWNWVARSVVIDNKSVTTEDR